MGNYYWPDVSCIITAVYFRKPKSFNFNRECFKLSYRTCRNLLQLGISSFITQMAIVIIISVSNNMIVITGGLSKFGTDIPLSVICIVMKVFGIVIAFQLV